MSTLAGTVTAAVALLFALLGSATLLLTLALLLTTVPLGTLEARAATTVTVAVADVAMLPKVQVSGCAGLPGIPAVQEPALGVALSTLSCPGMVSLTTTPVAVDGPALLTMMV